MYEDFLNSNLEKEVIIDTPSSTKDKEIILKSMQEYNIWDPQSGKLAIGYHSVSQHFDQATKNIANYSVRCWRPLF